MARIRANNASGGGGGYFDVKTPTTSAYVDDGIELGFVPTRIFMEGFMSGTYSGAFSIDFDVVNSQIYQSYGTSQNRNNVTLSYLGTNMYVSGTKLYLKAPNASMSVPFYIMAIS